MIDRNLCMASREGDIGGDRCQQPATHDSITGRRCQKHADELKERLADPTSLGNFVAGRARTPEEITRMVWELAPEKSA